MNTEIYIEKISEDAILPSYAHEGDAGMDLYSVEDVVIEPGQTVLVKTGLKMAIPVGMEVQIRPRSGISLNTPLRIPNAPGTIDSGYRGEICVIMENTSAVDKAEEGHVFSLKDKGNHKGTYKITKGDRVAQMVVATYVKAEFSLVSDVSVIGNDRAGGFGSTGV